MQNESSSFIVASLSDQMISGQLVINGIKTMITFVYAKCSYYVHRRLQRELEQVSGMGQPWLIGDFDSIREDGERIGVQPHPLATMEDFNNCINKCEFLKPNSSRGNLSWCNGKKGLNRKWVKLDKALVNTQFINRFN